MKSSCIVLFTLICLLFTATASARSTLQSGAHGSDVKNLNLRLQKLSYLPSGKVSSNYDTATFQAVTAFQKWTGIARDGVAGSQTRSRLARSTYPTLKGGKVRRVEVDLSKQLAFWVSDTGRVIRTMAVSTGAPGTSTPTGHYQVFRKETSSYSIPFKVWLPWASYFTGGIAFHQYNPVPAYAASHGCVRVPAVFAQSFYTWLKMGSNVWVHA